MENNSKQRKRGAVLSYVSIIINVLIQFIYTPLLIRQLGQSEYGLYSLVSSIIGYLTVLDLGFGNAIIVYTSKYRTQGDAEAERKLHGMFKKVFDIIALIAIFCGIVLFFNVDNFFGNTMNEIELKKTKVMMLILAFNLGITFSFTIYSSILSAYEKFTFQKVMSIISAILKPCIMIPLLYLGFKSITMTIVITIVNIGILLSNYIYCKNKLHISTKFCGFDKILFKTILGYSIWVFLGVIVDKINWSIDQFILGAISGTVAVSIYSIAGQINSLFVNLSTAVSSVLLPKISKMVARGSNQDELTDEMIKVGRIQFYIILLMTSGLILFGKKFIMYWAGQEYIDSYYCVIMLIIPTAIPLIQNLGISIRQAMNKHKFATLINIFVAIFNLIISIFLAKKYGPIGSACGTGIGILLSSIIINLYYQLNLKLNMIKFWNSILKIGLPCLIPIGIIFIAMKTFPIQGIKEILIYGTLYTLMYCLVAYKFSMNQYEKSIMKNMLKKGKV